MNIQEVLEPCKNNGVSSNPEKRKEKEITEVKHILDEKTKPKITGKCNIFKKKYQRTNNYYLLLFLLFLNNYFPILYEYFEGKYLSPWNL